MQRLEFFGGAFCVQMRLGFEMVGPLDFRLNKQTQYLPQLYRACSFQIVWKALRLVMNPERGSFGLCCVAPESHFR